MYECGNRETKQYQLHRSSYYLINAISGGHSMRKFTHRKGFSSVSDMICMIDIDAEWPFTGPNNFLLYF